MAVSRLTQAIQAANAQGRKALIPYLPGGYPDKERFWEEIKALDRGGADIIEIGVPFSDPVADGPVIEAAALHCLEQCVDLPWILDTLKRERNSIAAQVVLMGYYNPFLQYGLESLARDAAASGVAGIICPDLPLEESAAFVKQLSSHGLDLISLVGLNTSAERLKMYADKATGFVYFVSVMGITGSGTGLPRELKQGLQVAREIFTLPIALGFGLSSLDQLEELEDLVDGVVFGSSLIRHINAGHPTSEFMKRWRD